MSLKRIFKIRDSIMFDGGSKNKSHWYMKSRNRTDGEYYKQITHLYYKDPKRFKQLDSGILIKNKITSFETPQGVYKKKYKPLRIAKTDIVGKRIVFIKKIK